MFDRIWVSCPNCKTDVEFQSKAGECSLKDYTLDDAPPEIKLDIVGDERLCECDTLVEIKLTGACVVITAVIKKE